MKDISLGQKFICFIYCFICLLFYLSDVLFICGFIYLMFYLSVVLFIWCFIYLWFYLSVVLFICGFHFQLSYVIPLVEKLLQSSSPSHGRRPRVRLTLLGLSVEYITYHWVLFVGLNLQYFSIALIGLTSIVTYSYNIYALIVTNESSV